MLNRFLLCLLVLDQIVESDSAVLYLKSAMKPQLKVSPFRIVFHLFLHSYHCLGTNFFIDFLSLEAPGSCGQYKFKSQTL